MSDLDRIRVSIGIFARSGSKGLENKNILPFANSNLLTHTIEQAREFLISLNATPTEVYVSTDSTKYAEIADEAGAQVPFLRPIELSGDDSPELYAWKHMIKFLRDRKNHPDVFIVLPVTSPLRKMEHINGAFDIFLQSRYDLVFVGCESNKNPYFSLFERDNEGFYKTSKEIMPPPTRRQECPIVLENCNSVYVTKPKYVLETNSIYSGRLGMTKIPNSESIDIDTRRDYELAKLLYSSEHNYPS